jgi:hypothetical protein
VNGHCDCCGKHHCEPDRYPTELGDHWQCQECGRLYRSFDLHAELPPDHISRHIPSGTLGWTSRPPSASRALTQPNLHDLADVAQEFGVNLEEDA